MPYGRLGSAATTAAIIFLSACSSVGLSEQSAPQPGGLADVREISLPQGAAAWLVEESFVPVLSVELAWPSGAASDPDGLEGTHWVLSYMMNEGAGLLDSQAFAGRMQDLNMSFGCSSDPDWFSCQMTTLSANATEAFNLLGLALAEPRFDREPLERARRTLEVMLAEEQTDPGSIAGRAMAEAIIPGDPYARRITPKSSSQITSAVLRDVHSQVISGSGLIATIVGDVSEQQAKEFLLSLTDRLPGASAGETPPLPAAAPRPAPSEPVVRPLPTPQTLVVFSAPGPSRDDPDFYAAFVLNYILGGGGFSSRLMDDIREERGLTYGIGTSLSTQKRVSRWVGSASTQNETAAEVVRLVRYHIDRLGTEGPTDDEIDDAKSYLTGAYPLSFDTNAKIAGNLMQVMQDGLPAQYLVQRNELINAVSRKDIMRVANRWLRSEAFAFVLVGQPALK